MPPPPRYSLDVLTLTLACVRRVVDPSVKVFTRIPDELNKHVPIVVVRRTAGRSQFPRFTDRPWINTQVWCGGDDPFLDAYNLIDQVRGALYTAWDEQFVVPGVGWIIDIRESSGPEELADPDLPHFGRYQMTHEIRMRHHLG